MSQVGRQAPAAFFSAPRARGVPLLVAPVAWFNQTLWPGLSGRTLLPVDILYTFEPWRSLHPGITAHNALLGDLVFQTGPWRTHIKDALAAGDVRPAPIEPGGISDHKLGRMVHDVIRDQ